MGKRRRKRRQRRDPLPPWVDLGVRLFAALISLATLVVSVRS